MKVAGQIIGRGVYSTQWNLSPKGYANPRALCECLKAWNQFYSRYHYFMLEKQKKNVNPWFRKTNASRWLWKRITGFIFIFRMKSPCWFDYLGSYVHSTARDVTHLATDAPCQHSECYALTDLIVWKNELSGKSKHHNQSPLILVLAI